MAPETSDVDVLVVTGRDRSVAEQRALGETIAAVGGCPGTGVELSVVTVAGLAAGLRFEVHVNTAGEHPVVIPGGDRDGDPDLVLHVAVCRQHGLAVHGPPPADVFAPVDRALILRAMADELDWALPNAPPEYTVLNACRALRYATGDGMLCSKVDGAAWYLANVGPDPLVAAALAGRPVDRSAVAAFLRSAGPVADVLRAVGGD